MPDRLERIFRIGCLVLGLLLVARLALAVGRATTLHNVSIPALPRLVVENVTNQPATAPAHSSTNKEANVAASKTVSNAPAAPPAPMMMMMGGPPKDDLPPAVKSQVDRIVESEILAPFMRPMPMALLGIADDEAFLRGPDGQTGAIKEGGQVGAVKLLRIGVNRVLVEEKGEKKELTVFNGAGGESLLSDSNHPPSTNSAPSPTNGQTANLNSQLNGRKKP